MNLESKKSTINKSQKEFYEFLTENLENFKQLMPENIEKFVVEGESFVFGLKGMPEIRLVVKEKEKYDKVVLGAASSKLDFSITTLIDEISDSACEAQLFFKGDFNPMMAMMVKRPLQKFIDTLAENAEKFGNQKELS